MRILPIVRRLYTRDNPLIAEVSLNRKWIVADELYSDAGELNSEAGDAKPVADRIEAILSNLGETVRRSPKPRTKRENRKRLSLLQKDLQS